MVNAQEWLNERYTEKRTKIKELDIYYKNLEGHLDLSDFVNLKKLICGQNNLTSLDISKCSQLEDIDCSKNQLTELNLSELYNLKKLNCASNKLTKLNLFQEKQLDWLNISSNEFQDLTFCSHLDSLSYLNIGNNSFSGSLKPLKNLNKLQEFNCYENRLDNLDVSNLTNLRELNCQNNKLTNLDCSNCSQLESIECGYNKLTELTLTNCSNINKLHCQSNKLNNLDFLSDLSSGNLEKIIMHENNFATSDLILDPFSKFVNLKELNLDESGFFGSLEPLKNLTKLEILDISNTDIDSGWEYLPESLQKLYCSIREKPKSKVKVIAEELRKVDEPDSWDNFISSLKKLKEYKLGKELAKPGKRGWKTNLDSGVIDIAPLIPLTLKKKFKEGNKLKESYDFKKEEINYEGVLYNVKIEVEKESFLQQNSKEILLPLKLYNIKRHEPEEVIVDNIVDKKKIVEKTQGRTDIKKYAILSYVCGPYACKHQEECRKCSQYLYKGAKKSLFKSVKALETINKQRSTDSQINYLWIDQLCINQKDNEEKAQEVRKMHHNYGNAEVTLISIQSKLGKKENDALPEKIDIIEKIIKSEWFRRSWCFQEGWLSEKTIFMFDDCLVDGRELAETWALEQPASSDYAKINMGESAKLATPLGWVHYKDGYNSEDRVSLTLSQALRGIKERDRTVVIDGIYSVLGLLPYGKDVKVIYKPKLCTECKEKKLEECPHSEEKKEWPIYDKKDAKLALSEVIKTAWEKGYGEALAWHGEGNGLLPDISMKDVRGIKAGSTSIVGGIFTKYKKGSMFFSSDGIKINASEYVINEVGEEIITMESGEGFLIDGGLCAKDAWVKFNKKQEKIKLWGTRKTLKKINKDSILLIPNKEEWESNIPFAILVKKEGEVYHRLGLVEIRNDADKLQGESEKELTLVIDDNKVEEELQTKEEVEKQELSDLDQQIKEKKVELENMHVNALKIEKELQELKEKKIQLEAKIHVNPYQK